ncbi:kinase-like domain-containing protein, partial [Cyathus striatus]
VIHCDLKPGNILLNNQGTAVITDFGLSYVSSRSGPLRPHFQYTSGDVGTSPYMAPEILNSRYRRGGFGAEIV